MSKLVRVAEDFARRPQLQERLTSRIANTINNHLNARGSLVVIEAAHVYDNQRLSSFHGQGLKGIYNIFVNS